MQFPSGKSVSRVLGILSAAVLTVALTGCGMGTTAGPEVHSLVNLGGSAHAGPYGDGLAQVRLYATTTAPYGTGGTQLAETYTDQFGFFNFGNTAAVCPSGQQAYITVQSGDPGFGGSTTGVITENPQILLMAALGDCSGISTNTSIYINELTTVAAGYALSNFMSISGSALPADGSASSGGFIVHVSAPSTNNQATGSCAVDPVTGLTTCTAAGLRHAFLNAANLVSAVSPTGATSPTGTAYVTTPGNSNGIVPTLMINTLGNIVMSCVNSAGGASGDNPSTNCGKLFAATTPPTTYAVTPITPSNTLQAIINLAKFPTMTPTQLQAASPGLFSLASAFPYYTPALTSIPSDWSLGIAYEGPTSSTNFVYSFFTVLDINDNTYTLGETANGSGTFSLSEMSSNASSGYKATPTGPICAAGSPCAAGVDALSSLWLANTNGTAKNVYQFKLADGSLTNTFALPTTSAPNSATVDKYNNVFVTSANNSAANLFTKTSGGSSFTTLQSGAVPGDTTETISSPEFITLDSNGSIWNTNYNSTNFSVSYLANSSTTATPVFAAPVTTTIATTYNSPYAILIDGSNNAWIQGLTTLVEVAAPGSGTPTTVATITGTGGSSSTAKTATSARFGAIDGDGSIFTADNSANVVFQYFPSTGKFTFFAPCIGNTGSSCNSAAPQVRSSRNSIVDSTGSIWVTNPIAASTSLITGTVVQIIGTAAPAWPQASIEMPGVRP